jgi:hypothetical protein
MTAKPSIILPFAMHRGRKNMIRAYRLYTGPGGNSQLAVGAIRPDVLVNATSIHFKETATHSNYD